MKTLRPVLQAESSECGLACLVMVCNAYGKDISLSSARRTFPSSGRGMPLSSLLKIASTLGFISRPLKVEMEGLSALRTPCILHWDLNHFVVLSRIRGDRVVILDPASGEQTLTLAAVSKHFTGIAVEFMPTASFEKTTAAPKVSVRSLMGKIRGVKRYFVGLFFLALSLEFFLLLAPLFNQLVVDEILPSRNFQLLNILVVGFFILLLMQVAVSFVRAWTVAILGNSIIGQWMGNVFSHLVSLKASYFEKRSLADIMSRFSAIGAIQRSITSAAIEVVLDGVFGILALCLMLAYSVKLSGVVLLSLSLYGLIKFKSYAAMRKAQELRIAASTRESSYFMESLRAIAPIKLFVRTAERKARWMNLLVDVQNSELRISRLSLSAGSVNSLISGLENLMVIWLGAGMILQSSQVGGQGAMTIGMLFAFLAYKGQFSSRISKLIDFSFDFRMLAVHAERLADIVSEEPETVGSSAEPPGDLATSLELKDISFRYDEDGPWIFRNASLNIPAGQCVAIVGPSGVGKTTLVKILVGLIEPTAGDVLFGGLKTTEFGLNNFRSQVGTVMQDDALLTGTLAENICFFDLEPDQSHIERCAAQARIHEDILRMPLGYLTAVGDLGAGLSGGQKQRLMLARALYKRPKVLILDEATSHLDIANERAIAEELSNMPVTRVIIAHRPETIARADRVVRLQSGKLVDCTSLPDRAALPA